jgi:predicted nucleotide-binding protein (sugar kinase/HSP70/actin superfamily)
MAGSPYLQLEIDEHSADAGAMTRLEAFLDSLPPEGKRRRGAAPAGRRKSPPPLKERTIYFPRMSDHALAIAGAFRALGQPAEVLPPPDERSTAIGRKHTSGKECYPCIVTTGDLVRKVLSPGFDPDRSAFFMPGADGPSRFGQYRGYQERVLESMGYRDVPFLSPSAGASYSDLPSGYDRIAWDGVLAVDALDRLRRRFRPYAEDPASAEKVYEESLAEIEAAVEARRDLSPVLVDAARAMSALPSRDEERPRIGVVGEIFLRSNEFSNEDLVRKLERFGGEVDLAPVSEWILYTNFTRRRRAQQENRYTEVLKAWLRNRYQRGREKHFADSIEIFLGNGHEPPTSRLLALSAPYLHDSFEGEAVLTIGKTVDMAERGIAGVVSAMPFTCMPGTVSAAVAKRLRADLGGLPYLNMVYDGQGGTGADVRLEAFVHQARSFARRRSPAGKG